jgi:dynein heavy chain
MSRGNGLLLGVAGSGKQSLTRLASYISGYQMKQIEITKGYNIESFRGFIKALMRECSDKDKPTTFLFTDNQIIEEIFLEDINNILNSG